MRDLKAPSLAALALGMSACSGSGGGSEPVTSADAPPPPQPTTSIDVGAVGVVTGFGSVYVNGKRFEVNNATVVDVEDEGEFPGGQDKIGLGMKVRVAAQRQGEGDPVAGRIDVDEDIKGPARDVVPDEGDPSIGTFSVVGQTVIVDLETIFDEDFDDFDADGVIGLTDLDSSDPGRRTVVVSVSGLPTEDGLVATRIDRVDADELGREDVDGDELEVKGFVDAVAEDGSSLTINDAEFAVTPSTVLEDGLVIDETAVGLFVEVKADIADDGSYVATEIEIEDELGDDDREGEFELEGILQTLDLDSEPDVATIGGVSVEIEDAGALSGLVGKRVEIEGTFNEAGVLVLTKSKAEIEKNWRTHDEVVAVDRAAGNFTTRLGVVVTPTGESRVKEQGVPGGGSLTPEGFLNNLSIGDYVHAQGYDGESDVVWTMVMRMKKGRDGCLLRGPVGEEGVTGDRFPVGGVTVDTAALTDEGFIGEDGEAVGRDAFLSSLEEGSVVSASSGAAGACQASGLLLTEEDEVEIEGDDGVEGTVPAGTPETAEGADITGAVRSVDTEAGTVTVGERTIEIGGATLIGGDLVEAARGTEVAEDAIPFGELTEGLDLLLPTGTVVEIELGEDGVAVSVETAGD